VLDPWLPGIVASYYMLSPILSTWASTPFLDFVHLFKFYGKLHKISLNGHAF
jgi:hypothetical protein